MRSEREMVPQGFLLHLSPFTAPRIPEFSLEEEFSTLEMC